MSGKPMWTPGPWRVNKYGSVGAGPYGAEPIVAKIEPFYGPDIVHGDHTANAHLIAAAPEMYEALARIVFDWDGEPEDMQEAQEALRKARGETS